MGGDSNTAFDFALDKLATGKPKPKRLSKQSTKIANLLHEEGLIDVWRETNPHNKDYTHLSAPHNSFARIDHIFTRSHTIPLILSSKIIDSSLSDHLMVTMTTRRPGGPRGPPRWRLQESLLNDTIQCSILDASIKEYFRLNQTSVVSPLTVWAAHKSVIRVHIIQITSKLKAEHKADIRKLTAEYCKVAQTHKTHPTHETLKDLDRSIALLNLALTTAAEKYLRWTGAKFYSQTDKMGSRLAAKLSPNQRSFAFPKIKTSSGDLTQNPIKIMEEFSLFYSKLYNPKPPPQSDNGPLPRQYPITFSNERP